MVPIGQPLLSDSSIHKVRDVTYVDQGTFNRTVTSLGSARVGYFLTVTYVARVLFG